MEPAMTDEQKYFFDLRGWMLLPGVIAEAECASIRAHLKEGGSPFTGPAQELLDHPSVVEVLSEILGGGTSPEDYYEFRCEGSFVTLRQQGWTPKGTEQPHGGPAISPQHYRTDGQRIYSGLTRVVWELNPVNHGDGGPLFLSGSHKASFPQPPSVLMPDNPHLQDYACPAGSALIFTESTLHAATSWKNPDVERIAIFSAYNHYSAQYHRLNLDPEIIAAMPPKRQSLFRGVYVHDFAIRPHEEGGNRYYSETNRSL
jgi:hypothetical protein